MEESGLNQLLVKLSDAIRKIEYIDMLRILYTGLAISRVELEEAKSALDLFQLLRAPGILKPTDISVLFETIEVTGLRYLKEIIEKYQTYPDEVKITRFSAHRQRIVALGRSFLVEDVQKFSKLYGGKVSSNPWKLIQHLEYTSTVLTEDNMPTFTQHLRENNVNEGFNQILLKISDAISKEDEKYVDMLKILYTDIASSKTELDDAESAFDLFKLLRVAGILKPTDISVLFDTIEVTGLGYLKEIIEKYEAYPDKVKITQFSAHRQHLIALGKNFSTLSFERVCRIYDVPLKYSSNQWKIIKFLEERGIASEGNLPDLQRKMKSVGDASSSLQGAGTSPKRDASSSLQGRTFLKYTKASTSSKIDEEASIGEYLFEQQKKRLKRTRYYCPPTYNEEELDIDDIFTDLELVKRDGRGKRMDAVPASLKEILDIIRYKDSCKVLIEGEGGMGKTTLLRYISYRWANEIDNTFSGKIVFLIDIRDLKSDENVMDIILNGIYVDDFNQTRNMYLTIDRFGSFIRRHGSEIVLLLDGLDELNPKARHPIDIFLETILGNCKVILTSRPGSTKEIARESNVYVKVLGFNSISIEKFIHKFFKNNPDLGKSLIKKLHQYESDEQSKLFDLCRSPMLLISICTMWIENQNLPPNLAGLFQELFCLILNQYHRDEHLDKFPNFACIPEKYRRCFSILGNCIYGSLKENKLYIEYNDLIIYNSNDEENKLALAIGILYEELPKSAQNHSKFYRAPHKLIAESLAGYYLCRQCQSRTRFSPEECDTIKNNEHLHMTRVFAITFLGADADQLLQHWITNDGMDYRSLMQYLMMLEREHQQAVAHKLDVFISGKNLEIKQHFPSICDSLKTFVLHCKPHIKFYTNDHLIQHIREVCILENEFGPNVFTEKVDAWIGANSSAKNPAPKMVIFMMFAARDQTCIMRTNAFSSGDEHFFEDFTTDFKDLKLDYGALHIDICDKHVSTYSVVHLLNFSSLTLDLILRNCMFSATSVNSVFSKCYDNLNALNLSGNPLTCIEGFLNNMPNLRELIMNECSLSGKELKNMINSLNMSTNKIGLLELRNNDFHDVEVKTLSNLFMAADILDVTGCQLSFAAVTEVVRQLRDNRIWKLMHLRLGNNDQIHGIAGATLGNLLTIVPNLGYLDLSNCGLSGGTVKDMLSICNILPFLKDLHLKNNYFDDMQGETLIDLFTKAPKLSMLDMTDCQVSTAAVAEMITYFKDNDIMLELHIFLVLIDINVFYELSSIAPNFLPLNMLE